MSLKNGAPSVRRRVWVVHGRNLLAKEAMFDFLRAVKLEPVEWNKAVTEVGSCAMVPQVVREGVLASDAVVVLLTGDDEVRLRGPLQSASDPAEERSFRPQARPNVLFEAGLAMGTALSRTILVQLGDVKPFSNIIGHHMVRMDDTREKRNELVEKLKSAGLEVDTTGDEWRNHAGNFSEAIRFARTKDSIIDLYEDFLRRWDRFLLVRGLGLSAEEVCARWVRDAMYPATSCIVAVPNDDGKDVVNRIEGRMELRDEDLLPVAVIVDSCATNRIVGVITPSDLVHPKKFETYQDRGPVPVNEIMTSNPFRVRPDQSFLDAARYIDQMLIKSGLPVADQDECFVGFMLPHRGREPVGSLQVA